jgi:FkbM family methyltransferase
MKIVLPLAVRKLSCNPALRRVGHRLHVNHFVRRLYCRLLSGSGMLHFSCLGVDAVFKTSNSKQLAFMDYIITSEREPIEAALGGLKPGDSFLDVGCNYGIYSILASKLVRPTGRVIAVEPHPESLQVLRANLTLNGCQNAEVLDIAFSDTTGPLALAYNQNCAGPYRESDPPSTVHTMRAMSGDDALRQQPVPAAVKIDVEGHEFAVLCGLQRTLSSAACRRLCLEIHPGLLPAGVNANAILCFIRNCGFKVLSERTRSGEVHVVASR